MCIYQTKIKIKQVYFLNCYARCVIEISGDTKYKIIATISCPDDVEPLTFDVQSNGINVIDRTELPEDPTRCEITAWSSNNAGSSKWLYTIISY